MAHLPHQFHLNTPSFHKLLSGFFSVSDRRKGDGIEDDWEYIEVVDQELAGAGEEKVSGDDEVSDSGDDPDIPFPSSHLPTLKIKYTILSKAEVLEHLEDKIRRVSTVLLLSRSEAATLLHHFKWSVDKTEEEWLTCEEKVRKAVGLFESPDVVTPVAPKRACMICDEKFPGEMMLGVSCGHQFCCSCWTGYIRKAICDGPGCLALRCPGPSCDASVGMDLVELLSFEEDNNKFEHYLIRSCLTGIRQAKWCPAPGCDYAVLLNAGGDDSTVTCRCSYKFCFICTKEAHTPVDCGTVERWMSETSIQSENWLLANTKPCPICGCLVQKNEYCSCLECSICDYEFCCFCGCKQSEHVAGDDRGYECPRDDSSRPAGYREKDVHKRDVATISLRRYNHFYEGWITNESSRANALADHLLFQQVHLEIICGIFGLNEKELSFMVDAQLQIAECYQLLKWTYVYAYYFMSDYENTKKCLFEFMQEQGKDLVELFQKQVKEVEMFLDVDVCLEQFMDFRRKLLMLTRVTKDYFDKMVDALKSGLPEVVTIPSTSSSRPSPKSSPSPMRQECSFNTTDLSSFLAQLSDSGSSLSPNPKVMIGDVDDDDDANHYEVV